MASAEGKKDPVILYSYWRSSCSWRVRVALHLKGIAYDYRAVHLVKEGGEQLKEEYSRLNPMKEIPLLVIDGKSIAQSLAILEYLEETRPEGERLLPADPYLRAKARQLAQIVASDTQPLQNLRVLTAIGAKLGDDEKAKWASHWISFGLEGFEKEVSNCGGKYCVGDVVSIADLCLVPQLYNARRFNVDVSRFPTLLRIEKALEDLPAFRAAHPDVQPDCPTPAAPAAAGAAAAAGQ